MAKAYDARLIVEVALAMPCKSEVDKVIDTIIHDQMMFGVSNHARIWFDEITGKAHVTVDPVIQLAA